MSYAAPPDGPDAHGWFIFIAIVFAAATALAGCKPMIPPPGTVTRVIVVDSEAEARAYCGPATGIPTAIGCTKVDPEGCVSVVPKGRTDVLLHELNWCLADKFQPAA